MTKQVMPEIDREICNLCGECLAACPVHALSLSPTEGIVLDEELCAYCGDCEGICPEGAIRLPYEIRLSRKQRGDQDGSA